MCQTFFHVATTVRMTLRILMTRDTPCFFPAAFFDKHHKSPNVSHRKKAKSAAFHFEVFCFPNELGCDDFTRKKLAWLRNIYLVKKAYNRRKIAVKTSKCRDFTQILIVFSSRSYNGRNIIVEPSQRRYFTMILREKIIREKRAQARAQMYPVRRIYADIPSFFNFFRAKTSSLFVGFSLSPFFYPREIEVSQFEKKIFETAHTGLCEQRKEGERKKKNLSLSPFSRNSISRKKTP